MVVVSMLGILLSVFVIILFVIVYTVKNKEKGEETVIRHLYTNLVSFATLMMVLGGGISIFMAAADLIAPPNYYQSFQEYTQMREYEKGAEQKTNLSEQELREDYKQVVIDERHRIRENAKNQIIKSLGFIVIPLPVFLYFNRLRKNPS
ncbi:hypothetical protein CVD25_11330 [Bacillus canaveralius]|uniref:DUF5671 domain-containing protein n=1 Tax=Bacillus canaveralius TaxID=1403243 RepID=A0A2N5GK29_9BACI|nr:hypothetical protein [Bacillus canaveralius]PLR81757.1 hypothetical protein CU635_14050 [Bacillus canaveralius]PLR96704.1 hypothetical protein CVD25_11330 [Bacillus canaveralius]RSK47835.1 hypothetical protein EJA13_17990 [Bacillus canaveralius]